MKSTPQSFRQFVTGMSIVAAIAASAGSAAFAANATWNGTTDAQWSLAGNWSASPVPGAGNTATFSNAGNGNTNIDLGAGVTIGTVLFDTAGAASYTIGTGGAGSQALAFSAGGVTMNAAVTNSQSVDASLVLGTADGAATFTFANNSPAAALAFAGAITTTNTGVKTVSVPGAGNSSISGAMANGTGTVALIKSGAGVLTLSGTNTFTGGITVQRDGVLRCGADNALPAAAITMAAGTLDLNGFNAAIGTGAGNAIWFYTTGGAYNLTNTITTGAGTLTLNGNIGVDSDVRTISNDIKGKLELGSATRSIGNASYGGVGSTAQMSPIRIFADISGSGITSANNGLPAALYLSGNNSYTGTTTISSGYLVADHVNALGNGGNITFGSPSATLQYTANSAASDWATRFKNNTVNNSPIRLDTAGQTVTLAGVIDASNTQGLYKMGAGTLVLAGTNNYTGNTTVSAGTLRSAASDVLPNSSAVTVSGNAAGVTAVLDLDGNSDTLGLLTLGGATATSGASITTGAGTLTLGNNVTYNAANNPLGATITGNLSLGAATRTFAVGNSTTAAADLSVPASISGGFGLIKDGAGTMVLSGTNTYTGATTLNANGGVLQFNAVESIAGSNRNITVNSGSAVALGYVPLTSIQNDLLSRIVTSSAGAVALTAGTAEDFDFSSTGNNFTALSLGAIGNVTYSGTLTPNGTTYRLGGGSGTLTMANTNALSGANTLTVGGSVVLASSNTVSGATTINAGATLQLDSGVTGIASTTIADNGTLILNCPDAQSLAVAVSGTGSLVKGGPGQLSLTVPQTYTGTTTLNAGALALAGGSHTLPVNKPLVVNGGTLDLGTNSQYVAQFSGTGGIVTGSGGLFTVNLTAAGAYDGSIQGSLRLAKIGGQTLTLTGETSTSGAISVLAGALALKDGATLSQAGGAVVVNNAALTLDNTGTLNINDRVNDARAVTLNGGTITHLGRASTGSTETLGDGSHAVTAATGLSSITATAGTTGSSEVTIASLVRNSGATLKVDGSNLGTAGNNGRILLSGGVASLAGTLAPVNGVVPGVFRANMAPVGYVDTLGFGSIGTAGGFPSTYNGALNAAADSNNVWNATAWVVKSGGQTINSLNLGGSVTFLSDTDTLTIASGMIIQGGEPARKLGVDTGIRGQVTSGTSELYWIKTNGGSGGGASPNINSVITDNGTNRVKFVIVNFSRDDLQNQRPYMSANNTYSGGTVFSGGNTLWLAASTAGWTTIPAAADPAQGLVIDSSQVAMLTNAQQIDARNIVTLNGSSTLTLVGTNTLAGIVFNSNGGTATPTVTGGAQLTVTGDISATPLNAAVTPVISVKLDLNGTSAHDITVGALPEGNYPNGSAGLYGLTISSVIANGGFTKKGAGILNLTAVNTYSGDTKVDAGVVRITNKCLSNDADLYLATGAQIELAFSGTADDVRSLYIDGIPQVTGTWGASGSGADHINDALFRGTGKINVLVLSAPVEPVAIFSASPTNGASPLTVVFTDVSTGTISSRHWDFGNGATLDTAATTVTNTYTNAGIYTVQLVVSGPAGGSTNSQADLIVVTTPAIPPTPELGNNALTFASGVPHLYFETVAGFKYGLDYRDSLTNGTWQPVISEPDYPAPDGWSAISTGVPMTLIDTNAAGHPCRYYRLRAANP